MELLIQGVAAVCLVVVLRLVAEWALRARRPYGPLSRAETDELDALGNRLLREHHERVGARLCVALEMLRARRVPLGRVRGAGGIRGQCVLEFADGTAILARTTRRSDPAVLVVAMVRRRVLLTRWAEVGLGFPMVLDWPGGSLTLDAVAVDDPAVSG